MLVPRLTQSIRWKAACILQAQSKTASSAIQEKITDESHHQFSGLQLNDVLRVGTRSLFKFFSMLETLNSELVAT